MEHAAVAIVRVSKYTGQMAYAVVSFGGLLGIVPSITRSPGGRSIMTKKWAAMSSISTGNSWRRLPASPKIANRAGRIAYTARIDEYWDDRTVIIRGQRCRPEA